MMKLQKERGNDAQFISATNLMIKDSLGKAENCTYLMQG